MKKHFFLLLFAIVAGTSALWAYDFQYGDLYYNILADKTDEVEVTYNNNTEWTITVANIPPSVTHDNHTYTVTGIGGSAFSGCRNLTSVTIPNSVTSIGRDAFYGCSSLTSVTIPNSVTSIGRYAFYGCTGLTSVTIPNSVTSLIYGAFQGCTSLTSVTIPNSVTGLVYGAFQGCTSLTSVTIPNSMTSIGDWAFNGCTGLTSVTIPNSVTSIGYYAFEGCTGLTSITIPNSVTSIGERAFCDCEGLTSITIPNSVTKIGTKAFSGCNNLAVTLEATSPPTYVGSGAFSNVSSIYVPCGTLDIYKNATGWSNYASIIKYAPSYHISTIAENGSIRVPDYSICDENISVSAEPIRGFYFVRWADGNTDNPRTIELTQDITLEAVFDYLLEGTCGKDNALTWTFDPSTMALTITGRGALSENYTYGNFIQSVTIGNEVTSIGQSAFSGCAGLKNVVLGSSVKVLEEGAFSGCSSIESITCYSQRPPTVNSNALSGLDYSTIIYVPADYWNTYNMHDAWGLYDVRRLGATSVETTDIRITPAETTAEVAWPTVSGAATYELVIKDAQGAVVCTLVFNAQGQLTSIAFAAPANRRGVAEQAQGAGFAFTVTGLSEGSRYDLSIAAKDASGAVLESFTQSFTTQGGNPEIIDPEEGVEQVQSDQLQCTKLLRDGQVIIRRADKNYTLQGQEVR